MAPMCSVMVTYQVLSSTRAVNFYSVIIAMQKVLIDFCCQGNLHFLTTIYWAVGIPSGLSTPNRFWEWFPHRRISLCRGLQSPLSFTKPFRLENKLPSTPSRLVFNPMTVHSIMLNKLRVTKLYKLLVHLSGIKETAPKTWHHVQVLEVRPLQAYMSNSQKMSTFPDPEVLLI